MAPLVAQAACARRRRQTRSDVEREAIESYAAGDTHTRAPKPYDLWADVIGVVRIGARNPVKTTGQLFTNLVRRTRARRPR